MEPYYDDQQYNISNEESVGYQQYENSNSWSHYSLILPPTYNSGITSLEYDSFHDLIWMGHENGRISSYMNVNSNAVNDESSFSESIRYSSFLASDQAINNILPVHKSIFSVTSTAINMYTSGGVHMGQFAECIDEKTLFTRGTLITSDVSLLSSEGHTKTHLIVGTSGTKTFAYDLSIGLNPVLAFNTKSPGVCVKSSTEGNFIGVGCSDGNIRIIDGRLRSHHIERGFKAHTGSVNDLIIDEANMAVMSVGLNSRAINPYDPQSPVTYQPDTSIKVFDMRMMSPGRPIPLSIPSPNTIQSIPNSDGSESGGGGGGVMVTSTDGYMQVFNGGIEQESEVIYGGFEGGSLITSSAVSSSGQFMAIGSSEGMNQFSDNTNTTLPVVNFMSMEIDLPDNNASTPEVSLSVDVPSLGTSYIILEHEIPPSMPRASDFDEVGAVGLRTYRNTSQIQLSDSLIDRITWQGFIGAATRQSNVAPNSLLFGDKKRPHDEKCYITADPRKKHQNNDNDDEGDIEANDIPETYRRVLSHRGKMRINQFDYSACNATNLIGLENTLQHSAFINAVIQTLILLPELRDAALQSQIGTYHHTRDTLWCEIGFLVHHMLELQKSASNHNLIQKVVTASNFDTIFKQIPEAVAMDLFDNIQKGDVLQNRVQAFCRFLIQQLKSETEQQAKAKETKNVAGSKKIQIVSATPENSVVEDIFGFTVTTETTFLNSSTVETGQPNKALILDLIYPPAPKKGVKKIEDTNTENSPSFASVLYGSMRRVAHMKGWCSASESYEPLKQVRSVNVRTTMLPKVLTMNCGDTAKDSEQTVLGEAPIITPSLHTRFYSSTNAIGGPWVPDEFEVVRDEKHNLIISIHLHGKTNEESNDDNRWLINDGTKEKLSPLPASKCDYADAMPLTIEVTSYKLFSVVSQVKTKKNNGGHAVAQVRSIMGGKNDQDDDNWILLNDFYIQPCGFHDVCTFPTWKHPCILFYAKADHKLTTLNHEERDLIHSIPDSVLRLRSLSSHTSLIPPDSLGKGTLVAFDAEFVATESEKASLSAGGQRIVSDDGRQVLARISLIDENGEVLLDDYVRPSEPVVDYLTRFSGLTPEDIDPSTSVHPLITNRAAHLKLRYFLDKGCIFIGHGLQKDFETANLFVPPEQIRDTVELWRLPGQRRISLRFLAGFLLERKIQDEIHDSIEDAKTALDLYKYYMEVKEKGEDELTAKIQEIYDYGAASSWTLMS